MHQTIRLRIRLERQVNTPVRKTYLPNRDIAIMTHTAEYMRACMKC
jgi:hypothetical protein